MRVSKSDLSYNGYTGSCEVSFEDHCLHGKVLFIDDLITYEGETPDALHDAFKAAIERYEEYCKKTGKPANKPYSGSFNVRVGAELHRKAAVTAYANDISLNDLVSKAIDMAVQTDCFSDFSQVQHVHNYIVTLNADAMPAMRFAASAQPLSWEPIHAAH